jgi:hypothetical protein
MDALATTQVRLTSRTKKDGFLIPAESTLVRLYLRRTLVLWKYYSSKKTSNSYIHA